MMKNIILTIICSFLCYLSFAQVSLSSDDIMDIAVKGYEKPFTVIRDGRNRNQWYYISDMPRIVQKKVGNDTLPEFTLLRYQYHNQNNLEKLVEGGFLQFGVTMQLPTEVFSQLKDALSKKYGDAIRLGPVIYKSARVTAYTPVDPAVKDSSTIMGGAGVGSGVAPVFSTQNMVFSFPYNKIGSNVIKTLVNSQTGIPVFLTLTYIGLTPKAGFKVTVNWTNTYHHYSTDKQFRASASYFGLFGASYSYSAQEIYNSLIANKCITVEGVTGEGFTPQDLQNYLQPILARINAELLADMQPPTQLSPAVAASPSASGSFFSAGYSYAMKSETNKKEGTEVFDFNIQSMVERTTVVGGFIGIGNYSNAIKNQIIVNSTEDDYKSASIILPGTLSSDLSNDLKINKIDLSLSLVNKDNESERQYVFISPTTKYVWNDKNHQNRYSIVIPLMDEWTKSNGTFKKDALFSENMNISTDLNYTLAFTKSYNAYTGDGSINSLSDNRFSILEVNPVTLGFKNLDSSEKLLAVDVSLTFDKTSANKRTIKPFKDSTGSYNQPSSLKYIIPNINTINDLELNVIFYYSGGIKKWKYNNQNLKSLEDFKNGNIVLQETDIQ